MLLSQWTGVFSECLLVIINQQYIDILELRNPLITIANEGFKKHICFVCHCLNDSTSEARHFNMYSVDLATKSKNWYCTALLFVFSR